MCVLEKADFHARDSGDHHSKGFQKQHEFLRIRNQEEESPLWGNFQKTKATDLKYRDLTATQKIDLWATFLEKRL